MPPLSEIDPLAQRKYRAHWRVESGILTQGIQPLRYRQGRTTQQHYNYPEFHTRHIRNDSLAFRYPWRPRACIYCGASVYSSTRKALGKEHIVPEGTGGTLILENASCKECERIINTSETRMIHMTFAAL